LDLEDLSLDLDLEDPDPDMRSRSETSPPNAATAQSDAPDEHTHPTWTSGYRHPPD
nr:hypothetical protein [Tanacetum cinerariifolium]